MSPLTKRKSSSPQPRDSISPRETGRKAAWPPSAPAELSRSLPFREEGFFPVTILPPLFLQKMRPCERRPGERAPSLLFLSMVGARGFEPPTSWSRTKRANQAALRPERFLSGSRVGRHHTPAPHHVRNEGNFNTFPSSRQTRHKERP